MKQLRYIFLLLAATLLTGNSVQAQYLNFYGTNQEGSIPLDKFRGITVRENPGPDADVFPYYVYINYDEDKYLFGRPYFISQLTISDEPEIAPQPEDVSRAWVRYTLSSGGYVVQELAKVWGPSGVYHALTYIPSDASNFEYSFDNQTWNAAIKDPQEALSTIAFEGWGQLVLSFDFQDYFSNARFFNFTGHRNSTVYTAGYAGIYGAVTGDDTQSNQWKLSMPVNADGWWASPRFVASGEVRARAIVRAASGSPDADFTIHNGKIFWQDSDIPTSWAADKGPDYSVQGQVGQKLYVNFTTGEAMVSTPEETPFPLENPVFNTPDITGSYDNETNSTVDVNTAKLRWRAIDGASGYEIVWGYFSNLMAGGSAWDDPANIVGRTTVPATQTSLDIPGLNYATRYKFAIRALSPRGEQYHSAWYGRGNGRYWYGYYALETSVRYFVPSVVSVSNVTKTGMRINFQQDITKMGLYEWQLEEAREHFNFTDADKTQLRLDYITIQADQSTPNATLPARYEYYVLTADDLSRGYIDIEGLSENSVYQIKAWDATISSPVDACYNTVQKRTKSDPAPPVLVTHVPDATATQSNLGDEVTGDISAYNSMAIDDIINNYMTDASIPEDQVFYLEGGKTYHINSNVSLYKGITLQTNPADVATGHRARLLLAGMLKANGGATMCNFMLGRMQNYDDDPTLALDIDEIRFVDLDVDCPLAGNYGSASEGGASTASNYFMNMYGDGMGFNLNLLEWKNCTFQGMVRGFFRIQGFNDFYIQHFRMTDCVFYNNGYYNANGGGFNWIHADHGSKPKSNVVNDMEISGNVFYDNPHGSLFTDQNRNNQWDESVRWHLNVHHNTFVNFQTRNNTVILNTRYVPGGSVLEFHDNVIINTKDANDVNRTLASAGWDVRNIQGGDGSGACTFNIYNNWTTDENLTNGQPFATNAFNATSNAPYKTSFQQTCSYPGGVSELAVHVDPLKATQLMVSPNPQHLMGNSPAYTDHRTETGIDGLYYQQTSEVLNSAIYKSGAGAARLRGGLTR